MKTLARLGAGEAIAVAQQRLAERLDVGQRHLVADLGLQSQAAGGPAQAVDRLGDVGVDLAGADEGEHLAVEVEIDADLAGAGARQAVIFYPSPLPLEVHPARWITDTALRRLEGVAAERAAGSSRPFHLFVSHVGPHDPYDPPAPYDTLLDPAAMPPPLPRAWAGPEVPEAFSSFVHTMFGIADLDLAGWARLRALFFGSCRLIDDEIGRLLAGIRRLGLNRDLLVVFTTDHGEMAGDHGLLMKGPWHYDACVRVPLIAAGAGVAGGRTDARLVSLLDLFPTFAAAAGVDLASLALEGRPLPLAAGAKGGHADLAIESNGSYTDDQVQARSLVTADDWRLSLFPGQAGTGQMFDLTADPQEQADRFRDPAASGRRGELAERLVAAQARQWLPPPARNRHPDVLYESFGSPLHLARGWPGA